MNFKFLVNLDDHEGSGIETKFRLNEAGEKVEEMCSVQDAEGPHLHYNVTDTLMCKVPASTTYDQASAMSHMHRYGFETFFVDSGSMYVYIDGVRVVLETGDILHLQPGQQHAMASMEDVKFRGFFHDLDNFANGMKFKELRQYMPEAADDPEFGKLAMGTDHIHRELPYYVDVPVERVHAVKNPKRPMAQYEFDGAVVKVIIPRWENWGVNDVICVEAEPGFTVKWTKYPKAREMYYVRNGKVKFTIFGKDYIATKACLVNIPQYAPHSMEVLEKSEIYDMGGQTEWFAFLQDYTSMKHNAPERFADPAEIKALKEKFACDIECIGMTEV